MTNKFEAKSQIVNMDNSKIFDSLERNFFLYVSEKKFDVRNNS